MFRPFIALLALWPLAAPAQGTLDTPLPPALAEARDLWLNGRYDGIWDTVRAAAENGHPVAQNILAAGLTEKDGGQGVAYDPAQALDWYGRAAAQGFARAHYNMALFWQADHTGFGNDYAKSRAEAEQAIALDYPQAYNILGDLYFHGRGVDADKAQAFDWYSKGAEAGTFNGFREVGYAYYHGNGVDRDVDQSRAYLDRAVAAGDRKSIPDLAWLYEGNEGIEQDLLKSWLLYRHGVDRGLPRAAYELALFVAWPGYDGHWHNPVHGYGYCLVSIDWGHTLSDQNIAEECESLAADLTDDQRAAARLFADTVKTR